MDETRNLSLCESKNRRGVIPIYFEGSPFSLTADAETARHWAGRPKALSRLQRLARSISSAPESSLDIIWANFGAGKTHALLHLQHLVEETGVRVMFTYVEVPEQTRKFIELYRRIVSAFELKQLAEMVLKSGSSDPDLMRACQVIVHGTATEREVAENWLLAGGPSLALLRSVAGISSRIDDDIKATDKLIAILSAFRSQDARTVICLDEFQRLSLHHPRDGLRVMQSLRTVFSQCPTGVSMVLAIASRAEQTALDQLPQELKTLLGIKPAIQLPTLSDEEALLFLGDRIAAFRPPAFKGETFEPFTEEGAKAVIARVIEINEGQVGPRQILQAAGWALNQLGSDLIRDPEQLQEVLEELEPER